jgi:Na+-transporting NADH:ubiquinone oxidoreductase subunit B
VKALRNLLDKVEHHFEPGGKYERFYALYEMPDTFLYTPKDVTKGKTHVRDAANLKRIMILVAIGLFPCLIMALWNTGYQALTSVGAGAAWRDDFNTAIFAMVMGDLGALDAASLAGNPAICMIYGALYFVPIFLVTQIAGGTAEVVFSVVRGHEINEGFLVTGALYPLILPPTMPLWQVALGILFGVIIGKEVFGGTGMNVLNPALTGRAFLFFAYPAEISGDKVWTAVSPDGYSGPTWLANAAANNGAEYTTQAATFTMGGGETMSVSFMDAFIGIIPGSMGETSALACLLGMGLLLATRVASWRTMLGVALGTIATSGLLNVIGSDTNPLFAMPFYWHMVLGGWAFGMVFMATDPVSSAFTNTGRLLYGLGIGIMVVLVRVVNPAYPEGMMLAILFMNLFAPLFDHFVVQANIRRRIARNVPA